MIQHYIALYECVFHLFFITLSFCAHFCGVDSPKLNQIVSLSPPTSIIQPCASCKPLRNLVEVGIFQKKKTLI